MGSLSALALVGMVVAAPPVCGTSTGGFEFAAAVRDQLRCERAARGGDEASCDVSAPACASQLAQVVDLVFGGDVPERGPSVRRCRDAIRRATQHFVSQRTKELVLLGRRQATRAADFVQTIVDGCASSADEVPVGAACAAVADSGPEAVAYCARGLLEGIVQETSGVSIKPNILFILTDDQRWDTMNEMPRTVRDVFDRGLEFTESFTSTSLCCPDRASILTGLYAHNHDVRTNRGALEFDHQRDTIARQLRENAGYRTALIGKYLVFTGTALGLEVPPGWDEWQVFISPGTLYFRYALNVNGARWGAGRLRKHYSTDELAARSETLMTSWAERSWFIYYAPFAPHAPADPAARHEGRFEGLPAWRPPSYQEADLSGKPRWVARQRAIARIDEAEPEATDALRRRQFETLLAVDEAVGSLSDRLETLGLTDNTVVVYTSDNGVAWFEHWLRLKNYPYEEAIRVPLAIRYPKRIHVPETTNRLVQPIDFYPTFAELAGIQGEVVNGRSLVPLIDGEDVGWRDDILLEHFEGAGIFPSRGVRTARWKLVETADEVGVVRELYDLASDPYEMENLASLPEHADRIERLRARIEQLSAE